MKLLLILLLSFSFAIDPLSFIPTDKVLHAGASYIIVDELETVRQWQWYESALGLLVISLAKEQVDVMVGGEWDSKDIGANFAGYGLYRLIHWEYKF